jgi:hypothetical protein
MLYGAIDKESACCFRDQGQRKSLALVHFRPSLATDPDGLAPVHAKAECTDQ